MAGLKRIQDFEFLSNWKEDIEFDEFERTSNLHNCYYIEFMSLSTSYSQWEYWCKYGMVEYKLYIYYHQSHVFRRMRKLIHTVIETETKTRLDNQCKRYWIDDKYLCRMCNLLNFHYKPNMAQYKQHIHYQYFHAFQLHYKLLHIVKERSTKMKWGNRYMYNLLDDGY